MGHPSSVEKAPDTASRRAPEGSPGTSERADAALVPLIERLFDASRALAPDPDGAANGCADEPADGRADGRADADRRGDGSADAPERARAERAAGTPREAAETDAAARVAVARAPKLKPSRGTDTLFRNAYRAQLDMLALAATKANIMISLNGLLMSMLIISGTHFISIDGRYVMPIALLLVTCAIATVFAVLAARPDISRQRFTREDFETDAARLLVFEEFSDLPEGEYVGAMMTMLGDRQRVYRNMVAHVHELGTTADRKYRYLYYSYTTFMSGIILTAAVLFALEGARWWALLPSFG